MDNKTFHNTVLNLGTCMEHVHENCFHPNNNVKFSDHISLLMSALDLLFQFTKMYFDLKANFSNTNVIVDWIKN